jgi:hypothetical protein
MGQHYRNKETGEHLVRVEETVVETRYGTVPSHLYYKVRNLEFIVISEETASDILDYQPSKFPIDLYRILHTKLNKQLAILLESMIEASYAEYLEESQHQENS